MPIIFNWSEVEELAKHFGIGFEEARLALAKAREPANWQEIGDKARSITGYMEEHRHQQLLWIERYLAK
jgi:hypothetical protein